MPGFYRCKGATSLAGLLIDCSSVFRWPLIMFGVDVVGFLRM